MRRGRPQKVLQQQRDEEIQQGIEINSAGSLAQRMATSLATPKTTKVDEGIEDEQWPDLGDTKGTNNKLKSEESRRNSN